MSALVTSDPFPQLSSSCVNTQQHHSYLNTILYLTVIAIIVNSIYSMMIYNEVRHIRRHVQEAEQNISDGGRLLYSVMANMRECLTKLLAMIHPPKMMKSIVQKYDDDM